MGVAAEARPASPFTVQSRSGIVTNSPDGALDDQGMTLGTYMHGLFHNRELRRSVLECVAGRKGVPLPQGNEDVDLGEEYDKLAALVRAHLNMDHIRRAMGLTR